MNDQERIQQGDFLFGLGIAISEVFDRYLKSQQIEENDITTVSTIEEDEHIDYDGELEEIRTICENEGFYFIATKYFIPIDCNPEDYKIWTSNEFMIIQKIDYENNNKEQEAFLKKLVNKFKKIQDYFQLDDGIDRLNYYLYFPENILIDSVGNGLCKITIENEWEHHKRYGDHEDV